MQRPATTTPSSWPGRALANWPPGHLTSRQSWATHTSNTTLHKTLGLAIVKAASLISGNTLAQVTLSRDGLVAVDKAQSHSGDHCTTNWPSREGSLIRSLSRGISQALEITGARLAGPAGGSDSR